MADDLNQEKQNSNRGAGKDFCELDKTVVRIISQEETQGQESAPPVIPIMMPLDAGSKAIVGTTVAGIAIKSMIGSGGMSCVYRGLQPGINREVAVKMMHPHLLSDDTAMLRFNQEAHAVGKLDHPNIVKVHDFRAGENGNSFLVMDLIEGRALDDIIQEEQTLSSERVIDIFSQACDGLQHAHSKGIIHRDLKPSNIMLIKTSSGEERVKVLDFGIAKILPQEGDKKLKLTQTGEVFGSPLYMSPEQCMGRAVDQRSDIYAMGCLIYEALTGKPPFEGANAFDTFFKHTTEMPSSVKALRSDFALWKEFDAIILKAMAKEPKDRYQSMTELKIDLAKLRSQNDRGWIGKFADDTELARRKFGAQGKRSFKSVLIQVAMVAIVAGTAGGSWYYFSNLANTQQQTWDTLYLQGQESFDRGDYTRATQQFESALKVANLDKSKMIPVLRELVDLQIAQGSQGASKYESQKSTLEKERDNAVIAELEQLVSEFKETAKSSGPDASERLEALAQDINDKNNSLISPGTEARTHIESALDTVISTFEGTDKSQQKLGYARALHNQAASLTFNKKLNEAIPLYEKSAKIKKEISEGDPIIMTSLLQTMHATAKAYNSAGNPVMAEKLLNQRVAEARKIPSEGNRHLVADNANVAFSKFALAEFYYYSKHDPKAARLRVTEALRIYEQLEKTEPEERAECYALLAVLDLHDGKLPNAEENFQRAKQLFEPLHHKRSFFWIETLNGLGECAFAKKDYKTAEPLFRRSLAVALDQKSTYRSFIDKALDNLEQISHARGNATLEDLRSLGLIRMQIDIAQHGTNSSAVVLDYLKLFDLARRFNDLKLAQQYLDQAAAVLEKGGTRESWDGAAVLFKQATYDFDTRKVAEGEARFEELVALVEKLPAPTINNHKQLVNEISYQLKVRMSKKPDLEKRLQKIGLSTK
ncbi:MAG: serine/threonine-protein kinase [Candidatus Melainabacteria bacterium]|nr:serine/threonine-protein kinase [Candidatus Melainabacteria bacterium]